MTVRVLIADDQQLVRSGLRMILESEGIEVVADVADGREAVETARRLRPDVALIDLRERSEREKHGTIPGSLHVPYPDLQDSIRPGGVLHELARSTDRRIVFYCAFGERSAMAVQAAQDAGLSSACHIEGGLGAWKKAQGPVAR
jgi:rhodanese-related sulfurtransferase